MEMQLKMFTASQHIASPESRRRAKAAPKQAPFRLVTLLTPLHCEEGVFPVIRKKTRLLKDAALRAARWPAELRFDGAPFGAVKIVFRRAGRWQADWPPYPEPITAKVEIIRIPRS
jgi:hypothetical protein